MTPGEDHRVHGACMRRGELPVDSRGLEHHRCSDVHVSAVSVQSRSGPEFLGLSRCAGCYSHQQLRWGGGDGGESSSSAEDSGPEMDSESEAESSSSSSSSSCGPVVAEPPQEGEGEEHSPAPGGSAGHDGGGQVEAGGTENGTSQQVLPPRLIPLSHLPRPPRVVSTLHLQVQKTPSTDATCWRERAEEPINTIQPHLGSPWRRGSQIRSQQRQDQLQLLHQQHVFMSARGQTWPTLSLPVMHLPQLVPSLQAAHTRHSHLYTCTPQTCWYCWQFADM